MSGSESGSVVVNSNVQSKPGEVPNDAMVSDKNIAGFGNSDAENVNESESGAANNGSVSGNSPVCGIENGGYVSHEADAEVSHNKTRDDSEALRKISAEINHDSIGDDWNGSRNSSLRRSSKILRENNSKNEGDDFNMENMKKLSSENDFSRNGSKLLRKSSFENKTDSATSGNENNEKLKGKSNGFINKSYISDEDVSQLNNSESGEGSTNNSDTRTVIVGELNEDEEKSKEEKNAVEEIKRAQWGNGIEFLLSCIAMSVGLGNIWRFPFAAYENGGGAFLIPYLIVLILVGRPVYYMEMCLGQFTSRGNVKSFEALAPGLKGLGYGQAIGSVGVATYYCSLMAITLFYLIHSFTSDLPWSECNDEWIKENITCLASKEILNGSKPDQTVSSSELFFKQEVLKEWTDISNGIGPPEWRLTLCLLVSWAATFLVSRNGVQSSGKASYFLAIFPYVIILTLLGKAATLEGASEGMLYFVKPNFEKLLDAKVWYAAVTQCFFSLNIGFGTIIMYASYNDFNHNIYRDSVVVAGMDTFTSLIAGTTIFGILGNLAHKQGMHVSDVINAGGTGLAFISYPEAIAKFDSVPWLFAILFFVMLFILGVGSLIALQGSAFTVIMDNHPNWKKWHVSLGCGISGFLIGLVYVTPGGQFIVTLVDYFGGTFIFYVLTIIEVIIIFWWYGLENFCDDVEFMLKRKIGFYFRLSWGIITPIVLISIFIYFVATLERLQHEDYDFPDYILAFGWLILFVGVFQVVIWWVYYLYQNRKMGAKGAFKASISNEGWGPKNRQVYEEWLNKKRSLKKNRSQSKVRGLKRWFYIVLGKDY